MNILLWAPHGAGEHYWGPGISAFRLYKKGLPAEVKISLAHGCKEQRPYPEVFDNTYFIYNLSSTNYARQISFLAHSYYWIKKNYQKFDVVHVLGAYELSFKPALWFEKIGVPVYLKITGDKGGITGCSRLSKILGVSKRRNSNLNKLTGYIAISEIIKRNLINAGVSENKIHAIPNGVDSSIFKPVDPSQKTALRDHFNLRNKFTVIFVGGLSKRKQPLMLVKGIKKVIDTIGDKFQLILLGPARDEITLEEINKYIYENSLQNSVIHIDHTNNPQTYLQMADVYCLPSISEGMSNALLEAMSTGLPSIVTPISGSQDLIGNNNCGLIINNTDELVNAINFYFNNQNIAKQHGENARRIIVNNYDVQEILSKHLDIFYKTYPL